MAGQFPELVFNPTRVSGARTLGASITGIRIRPQVADEIFSYQPNANLVALVTSKLRRKREVGSYIYYILEKDRNKISTTVNNAAGYDADDTSVVVADGTVGFARSIFLNTRSMERLLVQSVSSNTWTVERRGLGSTAQPIQDGDELILIGNAYPENADVGTARSIQEASVFNYVQTVRSPFAFSRRDMNGDLFGGSDVTTEEAWQMSEHAQLIERAFIWGARDSFNDAGASTPNTTMGGIHFFVKDQNAWNVNQIPFNERNFIEYLEEAFKYGRGGRLGSRTKWFVCSPRYATEFTSWGLGHSFQVVPEDDVLGLKVKKYQSPHGDVMIAVHPLFEGANADKAFLLDFNHLRYVYFKGGDTGLERDRGGNGVDGKTHEWLSDVSVEVQLAKAHGFIDGISL
jgi:hypothetical protein